MEVPAARVRPAGPQDASGILSIYAPLVRDTIVSFETEVPDLAEMQRRIVATTSSLPWLVAAEGGDVVGYAYAGRHRERSAYRWSVEVSAYVAASRRGRGVGRLLYEPLLDTLRELGYVSAFAGIALPNPASVRLHKALGFRRVGTFEKVGYKHGAWRDVEWWRLALREPPSEPRDPLRWLPDMAMADPQP